ncbi:UB domain containing protein [Cryptosporidium ryanae]|uniref:UB domain containing protein n=1 Tax=Cryptosporidium ryanae TaxID=515981 RepID=UPI00351A548F|nr:UB domain containing protein [Cryptosporidium ryanae]
MSGEDGLSSIPMEEMSSNKRLNAINSSSYEDIDGSSSNVGTNVDDSRNNESSSNSKTLVENICSNSLTEYLNNQNNNKEEITDEFIMINSNTEVDEKTSQEAEMAKMGDINNNNKSSSSTDSNNYSGIRNEIGEVVMEEVVANVEENSENRLTIIVRPLNGRDLTVSSSINSTIRQLKEVIEVQSGIEAANQRLIFRGRCMLDNETVGHYFNESGVIIHLVPYIRNNNSQESGPEGVVRQENSNNNSNGNSGIPEINFQSFFPEFGSVSGLSSASAFAGGFPGAMMFGAIRLDRETGTTSETEDLVQRVLRSFGEAVSNSGIEGGIIREQSIGTESDNRNFNFHSLPGNVHRSTRLINVNGISGNNNAVNTSPNGIGVVSTQNRRVSQDIRASRRSETPDNINNTDINSIPGSSSRVGTRNNDLRSEHIGGNNPMGRIGTIVSRIFQAFNHPMADIVRDPVGNISVSSRRTSRNIGVDSTSNNNSATHSGTNIASTNNNDTSLMYNTARNVLGGNNSGGTNVNNDNNVANTRSGMTTTNNSTEIGVAATTAAATAIGGAATTGAASTNSRSEVGSNWNQFTAASGMPGVLPINGRPGVSVTTIPFANLSIPVTIRATSSTRIPAANISGGGVRTTLGVGSAPGAGLSGNSINYVGSDGSNSANREANMNNYNNRNDLYRRSSDNYFRNISDILEESASQLQLVASGIREIGGIEDPNSNRNSATYLPPIPCTTSNYLISNNNSANNGVNVNSTDYVQHHSHRLYISNELIYRFLPWNSLNDLMNILERDSGWRRPRIGIPPQPIDLHESGPLSVFISVYLQALFVVQSNLLQVQAWQERFARLDVPRLCYTVHMLTLISQISAYLASLLAWLFHNMAQHVEQDRLVDTLQWGRNANENEEAPTENSSNAQDISDKNAIKNDLNENNIQDMYIDDNSNSNKESNLNDDSIVAPINIDNLSIGTEANTKDITEETGGNFQSGSSSISSINNSNNNNDNIDRGNLVNGSSVNRNNRNYFLRPFSTAYTMGNLNPTNNAFGISRLIRIQTNDINEINRGRHESTRDMLRFLVRQTEANLNLPYTRVTAHNNLNNEYRAMFVRDLLSSVSDNPDYINDQDRFPYIKIIFSALNQNDENNKRE